MKTRPRESGFALLLVFAMAAAAAVLLYTEMPRVAFEAQRTREELLVERGQQYRRAIQLYFRKNKRFPTRIEDLEGASGLRFLRRRFTDPMTGKDEWRLIHVGQNGELLDSLVQKPKDKDKKKEENRNTFITEGPAFGSTTVATQAPAAALIRRASDRPLAGQPGQQMMIGSSALGYRPISAEEIKALGGQVPAGLNLVPASSLQSQTSGEAGSAPGMGQPSGTAGTSGYAPGMIQPGAYPVIPVQPGVYSGAAPGMGSYGMPQGMPSGSSPGAVPTSFPQGITSQTVVVGPGVYDTGVPVVAQPGLPGGGVSAPSIPGLPGPYGGPAAAPQYPTMASSSQTGGGMPAPSANPAMDLIRNLLTTPRPGGMAGLQGGFSGLIQGGGIAGVASTLEAEGIKVINERTKYNEWEFLYDLKQDPAFRSAFGGGVMPTGSQSQTATPTASPKAP